MATIHSAWKDDVHAKYPQIDMIFFGRFGHLMNELYVDNGKLVTDDETLIETFRFLSSGVECIDPVSYDLFLLYGMEASANFVDDKHFYSEQVRLQALQDLIRGTMSHGLLMKLQSITTKPVFVSHNPLMAADEIEPEVTAVHYIAGLTVLQNEYRETYGVRFVGQPTSTIVNGHNTHLMYSRNAPRLDRPGKVGIVYDDTDRHHMNPLFGQLWLEEFIENEIPPTLGKQ